MRDGTFESCARQEEGRFFQVSAPGISQASEHASGNFCYNLERIQHFHNPY
jgi:hypothetical protein